MNILMLSVTFPYPPSRGGTEVRTYNLLKALQEQHQVTLMTLRHEQVNDEEVAELQNQVETLQVFPSPSENYSRSLVAKTFRFGRFLFDGRPPSTRFRQTDEIQHWVNEQACSGKFDAITCEHSTNEVFVNSVVQKHIPRRVVDIHSSVYGTVKQQLATGTAENPLREQLNLSLLKRYEQRYCQKFTDLVVTTPEDAVQIHELCPQRPVHTVTNGVDLDSFTYRTRDPGGHDLVFVGAMDTPPNIDAAIFFGREVLPHVRVQYPDARLYIVGTRPVESVKNLQALPGVVVTGKVASTTDYLHQSAACVVPLRSGYGIKNKTLEAMAAGVPVVASDRGLEGLTVDGDNVPLRALRANTVEEYVTAIQQLFEKPELRASLSANARTMIEADFTWQQAGRTYSQILAG
ncbi:glycosyltransferase family 4 protein [Leptolyngbya iicbica]|uniref:Glycosyltransferase n=3 Tax=Cyanophyceae TaxID=3028117 RepID=A0A4Q7E985_9CYAN|nr:glycosyltransferase [Leptolyngbya sp. LK]